ncbi:MAG: hypothetical protein F6K48_27155 [Okeania sp. SIO3H1]|uniref:hypothetical protein n=1 Tax=Okeania sp. SIO1I7 TaxID=2607772 RepID=UPI0013CC6370|nr:hypothetical protein [Okeania sp. SIO1I7]NEN92379.1 hypothetical protein [Okeania sp. SIO3H1]NET25730.1 hypothetical protein [Okeania sp. SIO1I7]
MKQNIIALGLIASAGLTFCHVPKANAWNFGLSNETTIEESQTISYTGNNEEDTEEVDTGK